MIDFDLLVSGLDTLDRDEIRHVLRHMMATLGARAPGRYDRAVATAALARLTREQHRTLIAYCRGFLLAEPADDLAQALAPAGVLGYDSPDLRPE